MAAGGATTLPAGPSYRGMVGTVRVDRGRGSVVAGDVGGVNAGWVVGTVTGAGMVAVLPGRMVVTGVASSTSSDATVVVVAEDLDPEPEPVEEPEPDDDEPLLVPEPEETTEGTGARLLPERSGILSGGVASGGLALVMYRLKICAGSEPPVTRLIPCTS